MPPVCPVWTQRGKAWQTGRTTVIEKRELKLATYGGTSLPGLTGFTWFLYIQTILSKKWRFLYFIDKLKENIALFYNNYKIVPSSHDFIIRFRLKINDHSDYKGFPLILRRPHASNHPSVYIQYLLLPSQSRRF